MSLTRPALAAVSLVAALLAGVPARADADPTGLWLTEDGGSKVRIARCGAGYCGTVAWTASKSLDANNPDAALRGRPVVGIRLFAAGQKTADGYAGTLYNPKDGKTYEGTLKVPGPDRVIVSGCVMSVFCKGQTWTRTN